MFEIISTFNKYEDEMKSSYNDIISSADDFFDKWDPNTTTPKEVLSRLQGGLC